MLTPVNWLAGQKDYVAGMKPTEILSAEHRVIEQVLNCLEKMAEQAKQTGKIDGTAVDAVAFFRTFADQCHHGKEEDILFRDLKKKALSPEYSRIMKELEDEHSKGRQVVADIVAAQDRYLKGDKTAIGEIARLMDILVKFYPKHIDKEDKHFFIPCMAYFTKEEQAAMLTACFEFDRQLIHEKYDQVVQHLEEDR